jgi:CRISPR-associated protein Cmr6
MPIAAVPSYLGKAFSDASPGMRFGMYLTVWGVNRRTHELLWTTDDIGYEIRGQNYQEREVKYNNKVAAIKAANKLSENDKGSLSAIIFRQQSLAAPLEKTGQLLALDALSIAPFATGLGNEHPLENGFAFLNPYGLPHLPGSGVKGVLRQAARELASGNWGDKQGWTENAITTLFGREGKDGDTEHQRGALTFWDVIPQINGDHLDVEIMTPHQTHYYQEGDSPHESGQPNPISFLTVPPGSGFLFHVQCDLPFLKRLCPDLAENRGWEILLRAAFEHAFDWCGFGAKTAVGYGAMEIDQQRENEKEEQRATQAEQELLNALTPAERFIQETIKKNQGNNPGALLYNDLKAGNWEAADDRKCIAKRIKALWEEEKRWLPGFSGSNRRKVQQKEKCLQVLQWLEE